MNIVHEGDPRPGCAIRSHVFPADAATAYDADSESSCLSHFDDGLNFCGMNLVLER
jgi:hypothetical protein